LDEQRTDGFIPEHRDEQYWRRMADDAKECAATLNASQLKDQLLMLAERCERVAERDKWRQIAKEGLTAKYSTGAPAQPPLT
jgi:hypothetical protein